MIRRPPRSTRVRSSAASDVYKRQEVSFPAFTDRANFLKLLVQARSGLLEVALRLADRFIGDRGKAVCGSMGCVLQRSNVGHDHRFRWRVYGRCWHDDYK